MQINLKLNQNNLIWLFWSPIINEVSQKILYFQHKCPKVYVHLYIFLFLFAFEGCSRFPYISSCNCISSPENIHSTHHLVVNFDASAELLWTLPCDFQSSNLSCRTVAVLTLMWDFNLCKNKYSIIMLVNVNTGYVSPCLFYEPQGEQELIRKMSELKQF